MVSVCGTAFVSCAIGEDVVTQSRQVNSYAAEHFLHDGHGSVRQVMLDNRSISDDYSYDGHGAKIGGNLKQSNTGATKEHNAGEQFDKKLETYCLRARYYDENTGRFNRIILFERKAGVFKIINVGGNWCLLKSL